MTRIILATGLMMAVPLAPARPQETPLDVFSAAMEALDAEDWRRVAELCDPESLEVFQQQFLASLALRTPPSVEEMMRAQPEMPREVAEYFQAAARTAHERQTHLALEMPGVSSVDELRTLPPAEFFARWLESNTPRATVERAMRDGGRAGMVPTELPAMPRLGWKVLGTVPDEPDLVHVVYRHVPLEAPTARGDVPASSGRPGHAGDGRFAAFERDVRPRLFNLVSTLRRQQDGTWRLIADHSLFALVGFGFGGAVGVGVAFEEPPIIALHLAHTEARAGRHEVQHDGRTLHLAEAIIADDDIVAVTPYRRAGGLVLDVELTDAGAERLRQCTATNIGSMLAVSVGGEIRSAPMIRGRVPEGTSIHVRLEVTDAEAERLTAMIRSAWPADPLR
jgi:hypothetical protein